MRIATAPARYEVRKTFLPFSPPVLGEEEISEVVDTLKGSWITTGPKTRRFEEEFCAMFQAQGAVAVSSCTAALHTALAALGIGPGDEVITTPLTFCSTCNVIEHLGATPILVDVEPDTLNIDPALIERAITPKTKVILPVHYAGHPVELDSINAIAKSRGLQVVEDAAHPISAKYKGRYIGSGDNPTAFSFYATKNMTTAEGGMLTGTPDFIEKARVLSLHGMSKDAYKRYGKGGSWYYEVVAPGFKYNMTDIQASLGLCQLRKLNGFQQRRRGIVRKYQDAFGASEFFQIPTERSEVESAWHLYVIRLNLESLNIRRDRFIEELKARNIGTSVHFIPIHTHPYYRDKYGYAADGFPVAYDNFLRMISLPLNAGMTEQDVDDVINAMLDVANSFRR